MSQARTGIYQQVHDEAMRASVAANTRGTTGLHEAAADAHLAAAPVAPAGSLRRLHKTLAAFHQRHTHPLPAAFRRTTPRTDTAEKRWDDTAHPRDERGRFVTIGEGAAHAVSSGRRGSSRSEATRAARSAHRAAHPIPHTAAAHDHQRHDTPDTALHPEGRHAEEPDPQLATIARAAVRSRMYTDERVEEAVSDLNEVKKDLRTEQTKAARAKLLIRGSYIFAGLLIGNLMGGGGEGDHGSSLAAVAAPVLLELSRELVEYHKESKGDSLFSRIGQRIATRLPFISTSNWLPGRSEKAQNAAGQAIPDSVLARAVDIMRDAYIRGGVSQALAQIEADGFVRLAAFYRNQWPQLPAAAA